MVFSSIKIIFIFDVFLARTAGPHGTGEHEAECEALMFSIFRPWRTRKRPLIHSMNRSGTIGIGLGGVREHTPPRFSHAFPAAVMLGAKKSASATVLRSANRSRCGALVSGGESLLWRACLEDLDRRISSRDLASAPERE